MRPVASIVLLLCFFHLSCAQVADQLKSTSFTAGTWIFQEYDSRILQVTFRPANYIRNENLSDAVILSPAFESRIVNIAQPHESGKVRLHDGEITYDGSGIVVIRNNKKVSIRYQASNGYHGFDVMLDKNEQIFGGGERALPLNRRGFRINLYNGPAYGYGMGAENLNYSVPFITSSRKYALFFDNVSRGYFDIGKADAEILQFGALSGDLTFYVFTGNDYPDLLSAFHKLTGTQPLPPRWALGTFMSRFGYTSESQTSGIYNKMKSEGIPFDAVIFDLFWFGDSIKRTLGNLDWVNKEKWPDPKRMIADFASDGVKTILITEPFILEGTRTYESFKPYLCVDSAGKLYTLDKFYFGKGGLIDLFQKNAQDHFWQFYRKQMDIGVEGWWGDLGEPENHPSDLYHRLGDFGYKRLFSADEVHNIYGHYWTKMLYDRYAIEYPDKRLFSLNRSGFAGTQRFGIFPWSGDVSRSWSGLRAQLPVMLGMSMSGIPYIHADAGGFAGGSGDNELYVRWLQFALFTPIFRPHGTALYEIEPQAMSFPSEIALIDTPWREMAKTSARQRYEMLPYNYTMSYLQTTSAAPLVSPLYYQFSHDTATYRIGEQFMWGADMMIAPVLEKSVQELKVYLPLGNWYRWKDGKSLQGSTWISESVTLENIPVYVKAGSLIPLLPEHVQLMNSADYSTKDITWHYYASDSSSAAQLFDDDGAGRHSLTSKEYELITVTVSPLKGGCRFEFRSNGGTFPGDPANRQFQLHLHGLPASATAESGKDAKLTRRISPDNEVVLEFVFSGKKSIIDVFY